MRHLDRMHFRWAPRGRGAVLIYGGRFGRERPLHGRRLAAAVAGAVLDWALGRFPGPRYEHLPAGWRFRPWGSTEPSDLEMVSDGWAPEDRATWRRRHLTESAIRERRREHEMSMIEDLVEWWRVRHEAGECAAAIRERGATACPFCEAKRRGVDVAVLLES